MLDKMLVKECIKLNLTSKTKLEVIDELVDLLYDNGKLNDKDEFRKTILKREEQSSTGLEEGIAIPHGKSSSVKIPTVAFGLSQEGIDYDSLDGEPSKLFFMIAAPADATDSHIETLSQLSSLLLDDDIREQLLKVKTKEEVLNILLKEEKIGEELVPPTNVDTNYEVLSLPDCPTGIVHTDLVAETSNKTEK